MKPTADHAPDAPATHRYDARRADEIELRWQADWERNQIDRTLGPGDPGFDASKPKFYCLDMFPYPSGAGLHVGHPEGYTATDILCRFRRMRGFNVLHPMGFDAFGLPAEQYAVQTGVHPRETTVTAIDNFRRQLKRFGFGYDWSREFATIDPSYYRWTQWIWLKAYDSWFDREVQKARPIRDLIEGLDEGTITLKDDDGVAVPWKGLDTNGRREVIDGRRLAYLGEQTVNWCPKLGTVLANEEVIDGRSERGGYPVTRKPLRQWMFRITEYSQRLLDDLAMIDWPESTRTQQREWIGRSEGALVRFQVDAGEKEPLEVFTTRPDTIFGATYMVVAPEHPLVDRAIAAGDVPELENYARDARNRADIDRMADSKEKTGVPTGRSAVNPATGESIPIWTADYVLAGYGTGAIMAVPAHDQRDFEFARRFDLPIRRVVAIEGRADDPPVAEWTEARVGAGVAVESSNEEVTLDGKATVEATESIIEWLETCGAGRGTVNFKLRDWLFSRQRYWGEPFPIVFDEAGNHHPVSESALPVVLPDLDDYQPVESDTPTPPLGKATEWVNTTAGEAGVDPSILPPDTPVRRETNTMPGWAGSCWYYLRYADSSNDERFISNEAERYWMLSDRDPSGGERTCAPGEESFDATSHHVGGVDLYVGGAEHAVLHLLYARFWHKILFDRGEVSTPEPIGKLFHQGLITSFAYKRGDGSLVPVDEVEVRTAEDGTESFIEIESDESVDRIVAKMSKSLRNVVNPDDVIADYGADTFRLYEMAMGPLDASKPWNTRDIVGVHRFLQRYWRLAVDEGTGELNLREHPDETVEKFLHRTIAKVGGDIERLAFNTAIAAMIEFVNTATGVGVTADQLDRFNRTLGPFAPHLAEEIHHRLGCPNGRSSVVLADWPTVDPAMLEDETIEVPVQVMGKVRSRITVPAGAEPKVLEDAALADERIKELVEGLTIRKVVVVPGKLVNIVAN
ncbi:MAG: leucine--tRNA ligase [Phycisphaerae bacterium]|nr:leucine--tRNA ligase [Phycisphaerae bacterium]